MDKYYEEFERAYQIIKSNLYLKTEKCKGEHCFLISKLKYVKPIGVNPDKLMDEIADILEKNYSLLKIVKKEDSVRVCIRWSEAILYNE